MAYEPSNDATLLTRRTKGIGGDTVSVREYYYEPSDRSVAVSSPRDGSTVAM